MNDSHQEVPHLRNNPYKVAIASMVGTAIEFYDYYIYAAAAVLVFNTQFFDKSDEHVAVLLSLSTLALAFLARPIGSALFGHFGDRIGRKKTLVASLLLMGLSTVAIGLLPNYQSIGLWAPLLLCIFRIGQGLGLGGECPGRKARLVRYLPATGCTAGAAAGQRCLLCRQLFIRPRSIGGMGLAHSFRCFHRDGGGGPLHAADPA